MISMERVAFWKGEDNLKEQKFDFNDLMNYKPTVKVIVKERNQPNLDKMAKAFFDLLRK
jgi:hypothetical protein